jgi:hypothetical protein
MSDSSTPHPGSQLDRLEKLNLSTKLAYGVGDFGSAISSNILIFSHDRWNLGCNQ